MSYVLIGETSVGDDQLYVLWTPVPSGVQVLPIGSHDRRIMQVIGRRIMEAWTPDDQASGTTESIRAAVEWHTEGQPQPLVQLADTQREAIARALELAERDDPTLPAA